MLKVGSKFDTFEKLSRRLDEFQEIENVQLWVRDSRTVVAAAKRNRRKSFNPALKYSELSYYCVFGGRRASEQSKTQNQTSASGCPFKVRLSTSLDGQALVVKEICHVHNHEPGKKLHENPRRMYKKTVGSTTEPKPVGHIVKKHKVSVRKIVNKHKDSTNSETSSTSARVKSIFESTDSHVQLSELGQSPFHHLQLYQHQYHQQQQQIKLQILQHLQQQQQQQLRQLHAEQNVARENLPDNLNVENDEDDDEGDNEDEEEEDEEDVKAQEFPLWEDKKTDKFLKDIERHTSYLTNMKFSEEPCVKAKTAYELIQEKFKWDAGVNKPVKAKEYLGKMDNNTSIDELVDKLDNNDNDIAIKIEEFPWWEENKSGKYLQIKEDNFTIDSTENMCLDGLGNKFDDDIKFKRFPWWEEDTDKYLKVKEESCTIDDFDMEENTEGKYLKFETEDETNQINENSISVNITDEDNSDDSLIQDTKFEKYLKMWKDIYQEIDVQSIEENIESALVKSEPVEADQNSERQINEENLNGSSIQHPKFDKLITFWKLLYPEVNVDEQRNIYHENNGNVQQTMDKLHLLNEERERKIGEENEDMLVKTETRREVNQNSGRSEKNFSDILGLIVDNR